MIKKLLIVAVSAGMLALVSIGAAVAIGGPELKAGFSDGHFEWDSDDYHGPVATRSFDFDMTKPLEIAMPIDMTFERGETISMTVEGPKKTIDRLVYEDGELKVPGSHEGVGGGIKVKITAPVLPALDIAGPANIEITDLRQPEFRLSMAGAGNVEASGKVDSLTVDASGAGNIDLASLEAGDADVSLAGLGNADINASGKVEAAIAGAGNVTLHRKPRELDSSIAGLGNVEHDY